MSRHNISSFSGFHRLLRNYNPRVHIFRGVSSPGHKLIPKIGRNVRHLYSDFYTYETILMNQFKKLSVPYLTRIPENEWEWLAIAQHHGLPTRLLDWTRNPMVAGFFAVNNDYNNDSIIFATDSRQFDANIDFSYEPYVYDELVDEVRIFEPNHIVPRIITQNGLFTVHSAPSKPLDANQSITLDKIVITSSFKKELRNTLDVYGINKATLFPGLDGIAEYLGWFTTQQ